MDFNYVPGKSVEVPEIPYRDRVLLPADNTAVIVIDMQNDFVEPEGNLHVPAAKSTVPHIRNLLEAARHAQVRVLYTQDTAVEGDPEFDIWPEHCLQGTWGWQIIAELKPRGKDLVCPKNRYDGFYGSWLDHFLTRIYAVKNLVIVGTVSNICVAHTAASAGLRWFNIVMPANGISALTEFDQALTLRQATALYNGKAVRDVKDIAFE
jgi:nicotinamidase-related amidase